MSTKGLSNYRGYLAFLYDTLIVLASWFGAFALRFNFDIPADYDALIYRALILVAPVQLLVFIRFGLYLGTWRFVSMLDLRKILSAVFLAIAVLAVLLVVFVGGLRVPRSVFILDPLLLILMMGGGRFAYRLFKEGQLARLMADKGAPVVVFGAGTATISLIKELSQSVQWRVVALLDDDKGMHGREILGVKVEGDLAALADIQKNFDVHHMIIAMPSATHRERRRVVDGAKTLNLTVLTVPGIDDLMSGHLSISQIRPVDVEDLLGRDVVELDNSGLQKLIKASTVLVSGAGGSIGSELCHQILKFQPDRLVCLDISEYALYQLEQSLSASMKHTQILFVVGDVKNQAKMKKILEQSRPKVLFHAAAYKHVPLMENNNVAEALNNNVVGTYTLANLAKASGVERFVLVSTDKAVNPTNVMGASKRLAEMVCQGLQGKKGTRFVVVRFGNVLGSSGSVIPKFRQQIAEGGPITVTHPDITRYFMSIPEASQLVMQAGLMGSGGEIFVLDMGEPVRIVDLAKDMIKLSGLDEDEIKIEFTGLRPGEKLFEELLADDEHTLATPHNKLRIASARTISLLWVKGLLKWIASTQNKDESLIKNELKDWVEEYVGDIHASDRS